MKKFITTILYICVGAQICFATNISGSIRGRLVLENSPYIVTGDLIVNKFDTLRIDPGVELQFKQNVSFLIFGKMIAAGTYTDSIKFIPNNNEIQPGFWAGIYLDRANDSSFFKYSLISGATVGLTFDQCNLKISFSYFYKNLTAVDCITSTSAQIENNLFKSNLNAGIRVQNASPLIMKNRFYYNCESRVESVIVYNTNSAGIASQNILAFNNMSAFDCVEQASPKIYHNTVVSNEFGISAQNSSPEIVNNLIYMNQQGIIMENSTGLISFNDVYNNSSQDFYGVPSGVGVITTVNSAGISCDQFYNISAEPLLRDINNFNFEISPSSPLLDTGDPQNPAAIFYLGMAPDIGALESSYSLPVEITLFRFINQKLEWETASETDNFGFNIWRSDNKKMENAVQIGFVQGKNTSFQKNYYSFTDPHPPNFDCYYQLEQIDLDGRSAFSKVIKVAAASIVRSPEVYAAYPNPFNGETSFSWYLPEPEKISVKIYNILGEEVLTLAQGRFYEAGKHLVTWNGKNADGAVVSSGVYYGIFQIGRYTYKTQVLYVR